MQLPDIASRALSHLHFIPDPHQLNVLNGLCKFVLSSSSRDVFVFNGYAGTGKTSIVGAVIKALDEANINVVILAPTGRAAKITGDMAHKASSTIHKRLFRGNSADPSVSHFFLAPNNNTNTIFIVDEASLINDCTGNQNSLLQYLVNHVYSAPGCKMILIGDDAQLPPVGQAESTAMNEDRLRQLGLNPILFSLTLPARQKMDSGILHNATIIRNALFHNLDSNIFCLETKGYEDVVTLSSANLSEAISDSYSSVGEEETIIITRSNKRANNYNNAIRNMVFSAEVPLQQGERIIIAKNDYYWSKFNKLNTFIANGDVAIVTWAGNAEKAYGRYFTDVELKFPGHENVIAAKIMLRSLVADGPTIPQSEMQRFYNIVMASAEGEISHRIKHVMEDPYYNALQTKYAYCVTCHKAQGGQWKHVYIDMGAIPRDAVGSDFYRWLYTAFTRATEKIFLINPYGFVNEEIF